MIEHMDNFVIYGTDETLLTDGVYAGIDGNVTLVTDPDGSGGAALRVYSFSGGATTHLRYALQSGPVNKLGIAQRFWFNSLPTSGSNGGRLSWRDVGNTVRAELQVLSTGALQMTVNGVIVETTAVPVITANAWWHVEAMYDADGAGSADYEVRVEGITVLTGTVAAHANIPAQVGWGSTTFSGGSGYIKDLVLWNGTGALNNSFLGSVLVHNLTPLSDVALNWALVGGASGFSILDNIPPNDAQYIQATDPPPAAYVASLSDLPPETTSVKAVMTMVRAAKSDGGDGSLQVSVVSNGDVGLGADRPITVAQTFWRDVHEVDPDTAAPWLPSAVNAVDMQIDRTT